MPEYDVLDALLKSGVASKETERELTDGRDDDNLGVIDVYSDKPEHERD